jgi:hypothetical protein
MMGAAGALYQNRDIDSLFPASELVNSQDHTIHLGQAIKVGLYL